MKIAIVKHFDPEDTTFYGDFYCTVVMVDAREIDEDTVIMPSDVLKTYNECNTDRAEAFAEGYVAALLVASFDVDPKVRTINRADAEHDVG